VRTLTAAQAVRQIPIWIHLVSLTAALIATFAVAATRPAPVVTWVPGTDLAASPSPPFRLTDHRGVAFDLDSFRGRPVVLAFLFANCPDVCRLTAAGLKQTLALLGDVGNPVQLLAITTDPAGDDAASVRRFLGRYDLTDRLIYLTGPKEALPPVWASYHLFVNEDGKKGLEAHTDAIYILDKAGRQRSLLRSDFDPDELATALRHLLAE